MTERKVRCRYLNRLHDQCTAESFTDELDELQLCTKHMAAAIRIVTEYTEVARTMPHYDIRDDHRHRARRDPHPDRDTLITGLERVAERARVEADAGAPAGMVATYVNAEARHAIAGHDGHGVNCIECLQP